MVRQGTNVQRRSDEICKSRVVEVKLRDGTRSQQDQGRGRWVISLYLEEFFFTLQLILSSYL